MRILPVLTALGAALSLAACINVEREPRTPPATVVTPAPTVVAPSAPPTVTVRPSY